MTNSTSPTDAIDLLRKMWGSMGIPVPGMAVPTLDVNELDKKIADLKAVEGWLKMNLGMLQLHIQGLELQCSTLRAIQNAGQGADPASPNNPFANPALWPWSVLQQAAAAAGAATEQKPDTEKKKR